MKDENTKMTRMSIDDLHRRLTPRQNAELAALAKMSDEDIDFSDIPELTDEFWKNAKPNPFYRPVKQQLTLRIDADVIAWFKAQTPEGDGYQTLMNRALRQYALGKAKSASTPTEK